MRVSRHGTGKPSQSNWDAVDKLADADLIDESLPELDETFWKQSSCRDPNGRSRCASIRTWWSIFDRRDRATSAA